MLVLTLRTDKPEAEIGLYNGSQLVAYVEWLAHRQLAETLHQQVRALFDENGFKLSDLEGAVVYQGPGSFTGLRIGLSVANALAYSFNLPIVGVTGDKWQQQGLTTLKFNKGQKTAMPIYGEPAHVTLPRK